MILQPASLDTVTLRQGEKPLGFNVVPSFCGHHQLCDIRFGSPAHASGAVHDGDEIVQVPYTSVRCGANTSIDNVFSTNEIENFQSALPRRTTFH